MWDRLTSAFENFFTGGTWGAVIGGILGAVYALFTPSAVPGNEIYAMAAGGAMGAVGGALTFAGVGAASGLLFGSGDKPGDPQPPSQQRAAETQVARTQEQEAPDHGLPANGKGQGAARS